MDLSSNERFWKECFKVLLADDWDAEIAATLSNQLVQRRFERVATILSNEDRLQFWSECLIILLEDEKSIPTLIKKTDSSLEQFVVHRGIL